MLHEDLPTSTLARADRHPPGSQQSGYAISLLTKGCHEGSSPKL